MASVAVRAADTKLPRHRKRHRASAERSVPELDGAAGCCRRLFCLWFLLPCLALLCFDHLWRSESSEVCRHEVAKEARLQTKAIGCEDTSYTGSLVVLNCRISNTSLPTYWGEGPFKEFSHVGLGLRVEVEMRQCRRASSRGEREQPTGGEVSREKWRQRPEFSGKKEEEEGALPFVDEAGQADLYRHERRRLRPSGPSSSRDWEEGPRGHQQQRHKERLRAARREDMSPHTGGTIRFKHLTSSSSSSGDDELFDERRMNADFSVGWYPMPVRSPASWEGAADMCGGERNPKWPSALPRARTQRPQKMYVGKFATRLTDKIPLDKPVDWPAPPGWTKVGDYYMCKQWMARNGSEDAYNPYGIGEVRVRILTNDWDKADVTLIGQNVNGSIMPWTASTSTSFCAGTQVVSDDLWVGSLAPAECLDLLHVDVHLQGRAIRIIIAACLWIVFWLSCRVLKLNDCLGEELGGIVAQIACSLAVILSFAACMLVSGSAWMLSTRPEVAFPVLTVAGMLLLLTVHMIAGKKAEIESDDEDKEGSGDSADDEFNDIMAHNPLLGKRGLARAKSSSQPKASTLPSRPQSPSSSAPLLSRGSWEPMPKPQVVTHVFQRPAGLLQVPPIGPPPLPLPVVQQPLLVPMHVNSFHVQAPAAVRMPQYHAATLPGSFQSQHYMDFTCSEPLHVAPPGYPGVQYAASAWLPPDNHCHSAAAPCLSRADLGAMPTPSAPPFEEEGEGIGM